MVRRGAKLKTLCITFAANVVLQVQHNYVRGKSNSSHGERNHVCDEGNCIGLKRNHIRDDGNYVRRKCEYLCPKGNYVDSRSTCVSVQ
jgi:hypothetical protein